MFFKKLKGITVKVFLVAFMVMMIFFLIIMSVQAFLAAYSLMEAENESLTDILEDSANDLENVISDGEIKEINQYSFDIKSMLNKYKRLSDENIKYEFLVTNKEGEIVCSLNNEIEILYITENPYYKYARLDVLSDEELFELANRLYEEIDQYKSQLPQITVTGKYIEGWKNNNNVIDAYTLFIDSQNGVGGYYTNSIEGYDPNEIHNQIIGKYNRNYITEHVNDFDYFVDENRNRKELYSAAYNRLADETNNVREINNAALYQTTGINNEYNLVVRAQFNPLKVIIETSRNTYILLSLIMILLTVIVALIFSNLIVKPVRKIEDKAKKLAELDFSSNETYEYRRNDEIGSLYNSVNTLAVKLDAAITELKSENSELTRDIAREREFDAKRREFVAATSHELKTPLARIRGYAEALDLNLSEEKKDYYCKSLMSEIDIMNEMILEMLSLSRLEAENYNDLNISKIDIVQITKDVIGRSEKLIRDKNIIFNIYCDSESIKCKGDLSKIARVITNFVDNAIHYTPDGMAIRVTLREVNDKVRFEIENEGSRIDEDIIPYIWDSFYKGDKARTKSKRTVTAERTGLGLSIVKVILNLHRADFGVKNTVSGVSFYFELDK